MERAGKPPARHRLERRTPRPPRRLPERGYRPGHPGNRSDITERAVINARHAWDHQPADDRIAFAEVTSGFAGRWPADRTAEMLADAARRLNADEPLATPLGELVHGGRGERDETAYLGVTVTTGWIDPTKVAAASVASGGNAWNDFKNHRPNTPEILTRALLGGDSQAVLKAWNFDGEPLDVIRVPGPAGPLYERGSSGTHRIHTARMIGLPLLWAEIQQYTLPLRIHAHELFATRGRAPPLPGPARSSTAGAAYSTADSSSATWRRTPTSQACPRSTRTGRSRPGCSPNPETPPAGPPTTPRRVRFTCGFSPCAPVRDSGPSPSWLRGRCGWRWTPRGDPRCGYGSVESHGARTRPR